MIDNDDELFFAANVRHRILALGSGIENSTWDRFSDQSPNSLTRGSLLSLAREVDAGLVSLGAKAMTAHAPCGDPRHEDEAKLNLFGEVGYWRFVLGDGRADNELSSSDQLTIDGVPMAFDCNSALQAQEIGFDPCPCNSSKPAEEHSFCKFHAWPIDANSQLNRLVKLSFMLRHAIKLADDRRPRAAIREQLLLAVISLEQLIVPVGADQEIQRRGVH